MIDCRSIVGRLSEKTGVSTIPLTSHVLPAGVNDTVTLHRDITDSGHLGTSVSTILPFFFFLQMQS